MIRAGKGAIYVATQSVIQFTVGLLYYSIIARLLTEAEIGLIATLTFITSIYTIFASLSLPIAATKYISEYIGQNDKEKASAVANKTIRLVLFSSLLLLVGFYFILDFITGYKYRFLIMISCVTAFFATLKSTYLEFLRGLQRFGKYSLAILISITANRFIGIALLYLNYRLVGLISGWLIGELLGLLLTVSFYHRILPKPKGSYGSRKLIIFSIPLFFTALISAISIWADRLIFLALTSNLEMLGIYELAIKGSNTLALIWIALSVITLPIFSEFFGQKKIKGLSEAISKSSRYLAYIIFPAAFGLATISKTAMSLLYGRQYSLGHLLLSILSIFSIFSAFGAIIGSALQSLGETKVFIKITLATLVTDFLISIALIPLLGVIGSSIAKAATMVVGFTYGFYELKKKIIIQLDKEALWKSFIASITMIIPLILFETFYSGQLFKNDIMNVMIEITMGVVTYGFMLFLLRSFNKQDFNFLHKITPKSLTKLVDFLQKIFIQET